MMLSPNILYMPIYQVVFARTLYQIIFMHTRSVLKLIYSKTIT